VKISNSEDLLLLIGHSVSMHLLKLDLRGVGKNHLPI
jgi:hypothetical protein